MFSLPAELEITAADPDLKQAHSSVPVPVSSQL